MRFIIETDDQQAVNELMEIKNIEIIDTYEPIEKLTRRVERIHTLLAEFKRNPGSFKILNYYLRGRGVNQGEIDKVLDGVEEFMKLAIKEG